MDGFPSLGVSGFSSYETFEFFRRHLKNRLKDEKVVPRNFEPRIDSCYVASIFANYAQVSCFNGDGFPTPKTMRDVFNNFVVGPDLVSGELQSLPLRDSESLEIAGSQVLLMRAFFDEHKRPRRRISPNFYDDLGGGFFSRAAKCLHGDERKKRLFIRMAENFPFMVDLSRGMVRQMRDDALDRYLIRVDPPDKPADA